jgi:pyruvate/2-oxoglutarate dehydrogenase complex dihydrolipoamide acyltransferase (E2) component
VQQREHPPVEEAVAPGDGTVTWKKKKGDRVKAGERIGLLRVEAAARGPAPVDPAAAARIKELEALAQQDPVYRDFLEKERRALQQKRAPGKAGRELPITAPETGVLSLLVEDRARVAKGTPVAAVVDDRVWIVDAFVDGDPPAPDAACELRGDAVEERVSCRLDSARPAPGGSQLMLTVNAADAPWIEGSRSLRVRIAPPGTPPEPAAAPAGPAPSPAAPPGKERP